MNDIRYWLGLNLVPGIGIQRFHCLLKHFGSPAGVWNASEQELRRVEGIPEGVVRNLLVAREQLDLENELAKLVGKGVGLITFDDSLYPRPLKEIYDPPPMLYVKGEILPQDNIAVAVVGSRKATAYGRMVAEKIAGQLAEQGITVVSGMARGIDSFAHQGAMAKGGRTIAVLGCGVDVVYPPENKSLMQKIMQSGAVISEFPLGTGPEAQNFPVRNRIISGLSMGVVVVEAGESSGAMITADFALEHGREVFAVPGSIFSVYSKGPHRLLKQGAKLVEDVDDIIEELEGLLKQARPSREFKQLDLNESETRVYNVLADEPLHIDEIIQLTSLPAGQIISILTILELKGYIRQLNGRMFTRLLE